MTRDRETSSDLPQRSTEENTLKAQFSKAVSIFIDNLTFDQLHGLQDLIQIYDIKSYDDLFSKLNTAVAEKDRENWE